MQRPRIDSWLVVKLAQQSDSFVESRRWERYSSARRLVVYRSGDWGALRYDATPNTPATNGPISEEAFKLCRMGCRGDGGTLSKAVTWLEAVLLLQHHRHIGRVLDSTDAAW